MSTPPKRQDGPRTPTQRATYWYSRQHWLNIPVALLLLGPVVLGLLIRGLWNRVKPVRETACTRWKVVCVSHVDWDHVWQRNHHTMARLARFGHPVLYMTPNYVHLALRWPHWLGGEQLNPRPEGVQVLRVPLVPGGSRLALIDRLNSWLWAGEARARGFREDIVLWYYFPAHATTRHMIAHRALVYDIQDEYTGFTWAPRGVRDREDALLAEADVTLPGTYQLFERKKPANGNSHFYACGVEVDHFKPKPGDADPIKNARPRLGFFGAIDNRIDLELVESMATRHPEWDIFMLGPVVPNLKKPTNTNVTFTGPVPYHELPSYISTWNVALMPWLVNELTLHINPTKTLEYLAARRPIVSTALPDLRKFYSDTVWLAETHDEFIAQCERCVAAGPEVSARVEAGAGVADKVSWDAIVREMEAHVDRALGSS